MYTCHLDSECYLIYCSESPLDRHHQDLDHNYDYNCLLSRTFKRIEKILLLAVYVVIFLALDSTKNSSGSMQQYSKQVTLLVQHSLLFLQYLLSNGTHIPKGLLPQPSMQSHFPAMHMLLCILLQCSSVSHLDLYAKLNSSKNYNADLSNVWKDLQVARQSFVTSASDSRNFVQFWQVLKIHEISSEFKQSSSDSQNAFIIPLQMDLPQGLEGLQFGRHLHLPREHSEFLTFSQLR